MWKQEKAQREKADVIYARGCQTYHLMPQIWKAMAALKTRPITKWKSANSRATLSAKRSTIPLQGTILFQESKLTITLQNTCL